MPAYGTFTLPSALYPGDSFTAINAEQPTSGTASERIAIGPSPNADPGAKLSVQVRFASAPGAFEVDLQTSDTDVDSDYVTLPNGVINAVDASNVGRLEISPVVAKFARLLTVTQSGNAVNCTGIISR